MGWTRSVLAYLINVRNLTSGRFKWDLCRVSNSHAPCLRILFVHVCFFLGIRSQLFDMQFKMTQSKVIPSHPVPNLSLTISLISLSLLIKFSPFASRPSSSVPFPPINPLQTAAAVHHRGYRNIPRHNHNLNHRLEKRFGNKRRSNKRCSAHLYSSKCFECRVSYHSGPFTVCWL